MLVDVLGADYNIKVVKAKEMFDADNYGECDRYARVIKINKDAFKGDDLTADLDACIYKIIRHELIHAVFHEAGLDCYAEDETLVDVLANIHWKMDKLFSYEYDDLLEEIKE